MYEIYETLGIVLESLQVGEKEEKIKIFTKDFGIIWANISGTRKNQSKNRPSVQIYNLSNFFLVKGKQGYRITNGFLMDNLILNLPQKQQKTFINFLNLFQKLTIYDFPKPEIFELILNFYDNLKNNPKNEKEIETNFLIQLLKEYGYWNYQEKLNLREKIAKINQVLKEII